MLEAVEKLVGRHVRTAHGHVLEVIAIEPHGTIRRLLCKTEAGTTITLPDTAELTPVDDDVPLATIYNPRYMPRVDADGAALPQTHLMRIALVGPSSTGKTTLARMFAAATGIPFESVQTRDVMAEEGYHSHLDLLAAGSHANAAFQLALARRRNQMARTQGSHITDRTALDSYVYYLVGSAQHETKAATDTFYEEVHHGLGHYDLIVLVEYGAIPFVADSARIDNARYHEMTGYVYRGVLDDLGYGASQATPSILRISAQYAPQPGARIRAIMRAINNRYIIQHQQAPFTQAQMDAAITMEIPDVA